MQSSDSDANTLQLAIRIAALALLGYAVWLVINPLLVIICWSAILIVALHPLFERTTRLVGSVNLSAMLIGALLLVLVLGPLTLLGASFVRGIASIGTMFETRQLHLPELPAGLKTIPIIGAAVSRSWDLAVENLEEAVRQNIVFLRSVAGWFIGWGREALTGLGQFVASILLTSFVLPVAARISVRLRNALSHVLDGRTDEVLDVVVSSIRSVGRGVIGVSLLQSLLAALGFVAAGISQAGLLAFALLALSIIQIGAIVVLLPVIIWVWVTSETGPAIAFTLYFLLIGLMDNVLRAVYFSRDVLVPAPVIIAGAIGGALAFGLIGLFLGPVLLAVVWNLLSIWAVEIPEASPLAKRCDRMDCGLDRLHGTNVQ
jgi:predicted PurR-regulated permease PerM